MSGLTEQITCGKHDFMDNAFCSETRQVRESKRHDIASWPPGHKCSSPLQATLARLLSCWVHVCSGPASQDPKNLAPGRRVLLTLSGIEQCARDKPRYVPYHSGYM